MSEYICKEDLIKDIEQRYCEPCEKEGKDYNHTKCKACWVDDMVGEIGDAPFYDDIPPVVRGKNITEMHPVDEFICSECGIDIIDFCRYEPEEDCTYEYEFNFCPNCGAKMDRE